MGRRGCIGMAHNCFGSRARRTGHV
jgi:hypothetical protein